MTWIPSKFKVDRFAKEKNDCTVVAVSIACKQPYETIHNWLALKGRQPRKGINFEVALSDELSRGEMWGKKISQQRFPYYEWERELVTKKKVLNNWGDEVWRYTFTPRMTVKRFLTINPTGRFIVKVRQHVFTIIDGVCYDFKNPQWCEIEYIIKIT